MRRRIDLLLGLGVVLLVGSPALFTDRGFGNDFTNHLWLVWQQGRAMSDGILPTIFLHATPTGIPLDFTFQPYYGFYGGTLYSIGGGLSALLGDRAETAYLVTIVGALACAYFGFLWLARQLHLGGWLAHAPALVYVTSPYMVMDLYARGAWPEFVALCSMPLVVAGAVQLLRAEPWRPGAVAAFALGVILFTGSHNITLLWGAIVFAAVLTGTLVLSPVWPRPLGFAKVAGLGLLAVGVNAWFLIFNVRYSGDTQIANQIFSWDFTEEFNELGPLLNLRREEAPESTTSGLTVAIPTLAFAWVIAAAVTRRRTAQGRVALLLTALAAALVAAIMSQWFWETVGKPLDHVQFPYRLVGYVTLLGAGAVAVALAARPSRSLQFVLAAVVALSVVQGEIQAWDDRNPKSDGAPSDRETVVANPLDLPSSWYDGGAFADTSAAQIDVPAERHVRLPSPEPGASKQTVTVDFPPGMAPISLQVAGGPYVIGVDGVDPIGRTSLGRLVVTRLREGKGPVTVTIRRIDSLALTAGTVISFASLAGLAALLLVLWRRRRDGQAAPVRKA